jgi:hypothetical protein
LLNNLAFCQPAENRYIHIPNLDRKNLKNTYPASFLKLTGDSGDTDHLNPSQTDHIIPEQSDQRIPDQIDHYYSGAN